MCRQWACLYFPSFLTANLFLVLKSNTLKQVEMTLILYVNLMQAIHIIQLLLLCVCANYIDFVFNGINECLSYCWLPRAGWIPEKVLCCSEPRRDLYLFSSLSWSAPTAACSRSPLAQHTSRQTACVSVRAQWQADYKEGRIGVFLHYYKREIQDVAPLRFACLAYQMHRSH